MLNKLKSRKFIVTMVGIALVAVLQANDIPVPWEIVTLVASYILGEGAVDVMREIKAKNQEQGH